MCRSIGEPLEITCASPRSRLSEPNVTMNGASWKRVIRMPCSQPMPVATARPISGGDPGIDRSDPAADAGGRQVRRDHARQRHQRADRQIDAARQHDQRLPDADDADGRHRNRQNLQIAQQVEAQGARDERSAAARDERPARSSRAGELCSSALLSLLAVEIPAVHPVAPIA